MKVCHFTSAHFATDDRIYLKECRSLFDAGYEVVIVAKGEDRELDGVKISGCGEASGRAERFLLFAKKIYKRALEENCDVYHFHDPELLPYGMKLKKRGKIVIFDSHEDVPGQILDKYWIPKALRRAVSVFYKKYETHCVKRLDAVVTATPHIAKQFEGRANKITVVNNYPMLDDIKYQDAPFESREKIIGYAGGLDEIRGKSVIFEAMKKVDGCLVLAGDHDVPEDAENIRSLGKVDREGVNALCASSRAGVLLYQPAENHFASQPIKMFEYMAAGLPFVASDFPLWKEIVEGNDCGICVPPSDVDAIAAALQRLLDDYEAAERMGRNGRRAVEEKYSWESERKKLLGLYKELAENGSNTL